MLVTEKLQSTFDKNKNPHLDKLKLLESLWIKNSEFAEKCALMFTQIWATVEEITSQKENILSIDKDLEKELYTIDVKRQRLHRAKLREYAS